MDHTAFFLSYGQTGYFSKIVLDYINQEPSLQRFYRHPVSIAGIKESIADRMKFSTDRKLLVTRLRKQYSGVEAHEAVAKNIELLLNENTFTICTAHQPNIFTGPLYFIHKILHIVKLAGDLKVQLPENNFVPVYFMGSEDADLEELGHFYVNGERYEWKTSQTGAIGRMKVDEDLVRLLDTVSGQLLIYPLGAEVIGLMKECYKVGIQIEQATFQLVNKLFEEYGLVILLPDNRDLKGAFSPVLEKELKGEFSHMAVQETVAELPAGYKVQASGRQLNLFYLKDDSRERIEIEDGVWTVVNTELRFTKDEIIAELKQFPERFSPNVILRPVFQEWILPNIAFIGGGGEIAYWLQLKKVFETVGTPYPLLVLRNSFLFVNKEIQSWIDKLGLNYSALFQTEPEIINQLVKRDSPHQLNLEKEQQQLDAFYEHLKDVAGKVDITLQRHVAALHAEALNKLMALEKKMLRAEKRNFEAEQRKIEKIKRKLFPNSNLQERVDNLMPYYAIWGKGFMRMIYEQSKGLKHEFGILVEKVPNPAPNP